MLYELLYILVQGPKYVCATLKYPGKSIQQNAEIITQVYKTLCIVVQRKESVSTQQ